MPIVQIGIVYGGHLLGVLVGPQIGTAFAH
jgi:hypothetical protein